MPSKRKKYMELQIRKQGGRFSVANPGDRYMGSGFFGDIWNGIKGIGSSLAPIAGKVVGDIGTKFIGKKLGLGRRRRKMGGSKRVPACKF